MAHGLATSKSMAYVGATPWHGLGNKLEPGQSIDVWAEAADMSHKILRSVVRYAIAREQLDDGSFVPTEWNEIQDAHVLFRSDNKAHLGIVSDSYKIVQPRDVLGFFEDLVSQSGFHLETAGCLFGGKRYWAMARIGEDTPIMDLRDKVGGFLLLSSSADGSMATEARFTSIRVVCNNTLGFARGASKATVRVKHRSVFNPEQAKDELGVAPQRFADFIADMRRLADTRVSSSAMERITAGLLAGLNTAEEIRQMEIAAIVDTLNTKPAKRIIELANGAMRGANYDGANETAWGWLNAVTQYVDHEARAHNEENRVASAWFGRGDTLKDRANGLALSLAGILPA